MIIFEPTVASNKDDVVAETSSATTTNDTTEKATPRGTSTTKGPNTTPENSAEVPNNTDDQPENFDVGVISPSVEPPAKGIDRKDLTPK